MAKVELSATAQTPGAIIGGLRVMAVDGTVLDVPDSEALFQSFWISSKPSWYSIRFSKSAFSAVD